MFDEIEAKIKANGGYDERPYLMILNAIKNDEMINYIRGNYGMATKFYYNIMTHQEGDFQNYELSLYLLHQFNKDFPGANADKIYIDTLYKMAYYEKFRKERKYSFDDAYSAVRSLLEQIKLEESGRATFIVPNKEQLLAKLKSNIIEYKDYFAGILSYPYNSEAVGRRRTDNIISEVEDQINKCRE